MKLACGAFVNVFKKNQLIINELYYIVWVQEYLCLLNGWQIIQGGVQHLTSPLETAKL